MTEIINLDHKIQADICILNTRNKDFFKEFREFGNTDCGRKVTRHGAQSLGPVQNENAQFFAQN